MAYDKNKIYEQEQEVIPTMGIKEGIGYFTKEKQFNIEKQFTESLLGILNELIGKIYGYDIIEIQREKTFDLSHLDLPNQRIDIYCKTKQGVDLFIECKNPKTSLQELNLSLGQMLNYQMIIENTKNPTKLIFATSRFSFYIARVMKRFRLNYDVILHNTETTMFLLNKEL